MNNSFEILMRDVDSVKKKLQDITSPLGSDDIWSLQQHFQMKCGQLLTSYQDCALERAVERDLWNFGFRSTITQLQYEVKDKKGKNEAKEILSWFLNSASGFYIQLLNQVCSVNSLDFVFRRKDSAFGISNGKLSSGVFISPKEDTNKNALYLCQYCLIHLGDLARYRHQAKQAEIFYKHAVSVVATSGHPYNQLALLEAGRGNRLASVFLYIRAVCLTAPFPGAPSNLVQTFSKVIQDSTLKSDQSGSNIESKLANNNLLTKDEYINLFLVFHSHLFLKGDLEFTRNLIPSLSCALPVLVAGSNLTRTNLVQMFAVNVFACNYFSGLFDNWKISDENVKKEEERMVDPKEYEGALEVVEDLLVEMLAALLLPVHAMREHEVALTYPALPAIRLMFEWILLRDKINSRSVKKKLQIWSGFCKLVNFLQKPLIDFKDNLLCEAPLPEDWDLQEFEPLGNFLRRYRYRMDDPRLTPDQYSLLRADRLTQLAVKFTSSDSSFQPALKVIEDNKNELDLVQFEPICNEIAPVEDVLNNLEMMSISSQSNEVKSTNVDKSSVTKDKVPKGMTDISSKNHKKLQVVKQNHPNFPPISLSPQRKNVSVNPNEKLVTVYPLPDTSSKSSSTFNPVSSTGIAFLSSMSPGSCSNSPTSSGHGFTNFVSPGSNSSPIGSTSSFVPIGSGSTGSTSSFVPIGSGPTCSTSSFVPIASGSTGSTSSFVPIGSGPTCSTSSFVPIASGSTSSFVPISSGPTCSISPNVMSKSKSSRTNVALQAILKKNSNKQEGKQVKFCTPSTKASRDSNILAQGFSDSENSAPFLDNTSNKSTEFSHSLTPLVADTPLSTPVVPIQRNSLSNFNPQHRDVDPPSSLYSQQDFPVQVERINRDFSFPAATHPGLSTTQVSTCTRMYPSERFQSPFPGHLGFANDQFGNPCVPTTSSRVNINTMQQHNVGWNSHNNINNSFMNATRSSDFNPDNSELRGRIGQFPGTNFQAPVIPTVGFVGNLQTSAQTPMNDSSINFTIGNQNCNSKSPTPFGAHSNNTGLPQWWSNSPQNPLTGVMPHSLVTTAGQTPGPHNAFPETPKHDPASFNTNSLTPYPPSQVLNHLGHVVPNTRSIGPHLQTEGPNMSTRPNTNAYSLFGPLGGVNSENTNSGGLRQVFGGPPNDFQSSGGLFGHQRPPVQFPNQQSLWSGPSPLQRLLEQKMMSKK